MFRLAIAIACLACLSPKISAAENPVLRVLESKDTGDIKLQAEAGDPVAQERLAGRLDGGFYYSEAAKWYRKAAEAGRAESQYCLGRILLEGRPKMDAQRPAVPAQPGAAIGWLIKAADQNHAQAQLRLGQCYEGGVGAGVNLVTAYKWYLLAAEQSVVGRTFRDRLALKLSASQITAAKAQAAKFKAGERGDPRIKIGMGN